MSAGAVLPCTPKEFLTVAMAHWHHCQWCGVRLSRNSGPTQATKDHIVPLSKGGPDVIENLVLACQECNNDKADKIWGWPPLGPQWGLPQGERPSLLPEPEPEPDAAPAARTVWVVWLRFKDEDVWRQMTLPVLRSRAEHYAQKHRRKAKRPAEIAVIPDGEPPPGPKEPKKQTTTTTPYDVVPLAPAIPPGPRVPAAKFGVPEVPFVAPASVEDGETLRIKLAADLLRAQGAAGEIKAKGHSKFDLIQYRHRKQEAAVKIHALHSQLQKVKAWLRETRRNTCLVAAEKVDGESLVQAMRLEVNTVCDYLRALEERVRLLTAENQQLKAKLGERAG